LLGVCRAPEDEQVMMAADGPAGPRCRHARRVRASCALVAVLASGRAALSATEVNGNYTLRLAVLHYRTHLNQVDELIDLLVSEAERLEAT
jgi:hypothetical protein